jgi:hypothetical protein
MDWENRELDASFLLDSGILFEINRSFLHLIGVSLVVTKDSKDGFSLVLKDSRKTPESLRFKKEVYENGDRKLRNFMKQFGYNQMKKRQQALGWSSQSWYVPDSKRYKDE